jgi:hypothetical protein
MDSNRGTVILAGILLLLGALALLQSPAGVVIFLIMLLVGVRIFDQQQLNAALGTDYEEYDDEAWEDTQVKTRQAQAEPVYRHALQSVQRAGLDPDGVQVLTVDIGVIAFTADGEQRVYRTWSLPDDVDYIQPFVQLRLPTKANGNVCFEVLDASGETVFRREDRHMLERGRNFISPGARLPIHEELHLEEGWQLRVTADDVLLAVHEFEFAEATSANIRRHIGEDGEINTELRAVMAESRLPQMSLDDLLEYQEEEDEQQRRQG